MRMVRQLRKELGTEHGTIKRVAEQLGIGVESLRGWVNQAEVDSGGRAGTSSADAQRIAELERENRELRRANSILRSASASMWTARLCGTGPTMGLVGAGPLGRRVVGRSA